MKEKTKVTGNEISQEKSTEKQKVLAVSKLSQLKQTDGQVETQPRTLAQFFGETIRGKYHTTNDAEYELYLKGLNKTDLQRHAIKCGLIPKDDRVRLMKSLMGEFRRTVASYKPLPVIKPSNKPISKELVNFMAGGR